MKLRFILVLLLTTLIAVSCDRAALIQVPKPDEPVQRMPTESTRGDEVGKNFTLGEGESMWIGTDLFEITLESVISDSRCPTDVQCFWEGNVQVEVRVDQDSFVLTLGGLQEGDVNAVELGNGFILRLLKVEPYPGVGEEGAEYHVTLVVEMETSQPYDYPENV